MIIKIIKIIFLMITIIF